MIGFAPAQTAAQSTGMIIKRQALSRTIRRSTHDLQPTVRGRNPRRRRIETIWRDKGDSCKKFEPCTHKMVTSEVSFATVVFIRKGTGPVRSTATPEKKASRSKSWEEDPLWARCSRLLPPTPSK
jgi:hypothetical protein